MLAWMALSVASEGWPTTIAPTDPASGRRLRRCRADRRHRRHHRDHDGPDAPQGTPRSRAPPDQWSISSHGTSLPLTDADVQEGQSTSSHRAVSSTLLTLTTLRRQLGRACGGMSRRGACRITSETSRRGSRPQCPADDIRHPRNSPAVENQQLTRAPDAIEANALTLTPKSSAAKLTGAAPGSKVSARPTHPITCGADGQREFDRAGPLRGDEHGGHPPRASATARLHLDTLLGARHRALQTPGQPSTVAPPPAPCVSAHTIDVRTEEI